MSHIPDPYAGSPGGVQYADPQPNPPIDASAEAGDPVARPEFLEHCIRELTEVRNELSKLYADTVGPAPAFGAQTVAGFERDELLRAERKLLETRERDIMAKLKQFQNVASLGGPAILDEDTYVNEALGDGD